MLCRNAGGWHHQLMQKYTPKWKMPQLKRHQNSISTKTNKRMVKWRVNAKVQTPRNRQNNRTGEHLRKCKSWVDFEEVWCKVTLWSLSKRECRDWVTCSEERGPTSRSFRIPPPRLPPSGWASVGGAKGWRLFGVSTSDSSVSMAMRSESDSFSRGSCFTLLWSDSDPFLKSCQKLWNLPLGHSAGSTISEVISCKSLNCTGERGVQVDWAVSGSLSKMFSTTSWLLLGIASSAALRSFFRLMAQLICMTLAMISALESMIRRTGLHSALHLDLRANFCCSHLRLWSSNSWRRLRPCSFIRACRRKEKQRNKNWGPDCGKQTVTPIAAPARHPCKLFKHQERKWYNTMTRT